MARAVYKCFLTAIFIHIAHLQAAKAQISDELIPVISIATVDGVTPPCDIVDSPGNTITNNFYVPGQMTMTLRGDTLYESGEYVKSKSGMRIKRRGNSTGVFLSQHPYKIKLSKKFDLLRRDDVTDHRHKEWLLMSMYTWNPVMRNGECNILNIAGLVASKLLKKEWTPEYDFVQVVLNDQYQGMYYLMEPVSKGKARISLNADGTGFIIEHDVFWWNEKIYFKTDNMDSRFGYTYKEPDSDDVTEEVNATMRDYMNEVEHAIYSHGNISKYIDIASFAKWTLLHDLLGTRDSWGSNRFLTRYDDTSLIHMGPAWDYDTNFRCQGWSNVHTMNEFYIPELLTFPEFIRAYVSIWENVRPAFLHDFNAALDSVWLQYGDVFDKSMEIHRTKYPYEGVNPLKTQIDDVKAKMAERIDVLDELMNEFGAYSSIPKTKKEDGRNTVVVDMGGRKCNPDKKLSKGVYIKDNKKFIFW